LTSKIDQCRAFNIIEIKRKETKGNTRSFTLYCKGGRTGRTEEGGDFVLFWGSI
jgi:hypothetical protein